MTTITRGVRNNNPGNIRHSANEWQGKSALQPDGAFVTFDGPEWGIRAMHKVLQSYQRAGKRTIAAMIGAWAPEVDHNNTGVYVAKVAAAVGVAPTVPVDVMDYAVAGKMIPAMIAVECAGYVYPRAVVDEGLRRAGVVVPATSFAPAPMPAAPASSPPRPAGLLAWLFSLLGRRT